MFTNRVPLIKLFGFQVWIDWSWFILALLITWSLATGYFPSYHPDAQLSKLALWTMGAIGSIGLFVSIVLHELGHSLIARRFGMQMRGITLFIFGGVAEMTDEPPSGKAEFFMAIAGPIVSFIIGVFLLGLTMVGTALEWPILILAVTGWLGWINLILVAFNIIPAFPLDGGRVLRAALWNWKNDLRWATRIASDIGGLFGLFLIVIGVFSFFMGNFIGGIWWVVIGLFLKGASTSSYQQVLIKRALEGEPVERFMTQSPVVVSPDITIRELVDDYFYHHYFKMYPVVEDGTLRGCVTIASIKEIPKDQWATRTIREMTNECTAENSVHPNDDAMRALIKLNRVGASRLMVVENGKLLGILSLKDLMRFMSAKTELENTA